MAGRLKHPEAVARMVDDGIADFVAIGRALHADPGWARAALVGGDYQPCIVCNVCIDGLAVGPVACSVNPGAGRMPRPSPILRNGPRVVRAGGAERRRRPGENGARVTVLEERDRLGGQMELPARQRFNPSSTVTFAGWIGG
jgi:hypothetical protein